MASASRASTEAGSELLFGWPNLTCAVPSETRRWTAPFASSGGNSGVAELSVIAEHPIGQQRTGASEDEAQAAAQISERDPLLVIQRATRRGAAALHCHKS